MIREAKFEIKQIVNKANYEINFISFCFTIEVNGCMVFRG